MNALVFIVIFNEINKEVESVILLQRESNSIQQIKGLK